MSWLIKTSDEVTLTMNNHNNDNSGGISIRLLVCFDCRCSYLVPLLLLLLFHIMHLMKVVRLIIELLIKLFDSRLVYTFVNKLYLITRFHLCLLLFLLSVFLYIPVSLVVISVVVVVDALCVVVIATCCPLNYLN